MFAPALVLPYQSAPTKAGGKIVRITYYTLVCSCGPDLAAISILFVSLMSSLLRGGDRDFLAEPLLLFIGWRQQEYLGVYFL